MRAISAAAATARREYVPVPRLPAIVVPADVTAFMRDYLIQLDAAITKAAEHCPSSDNFRRAAATFRASGDELSAGDADRMADLIELDPRLYVAGTMHNHTADGTAKLMLHTYIGLLQTQAGRAP